MQSLVDLSCDYSSQNLLAREATPPRPLLSFQQQPSSLPSHQHIAHRLFQRTKVGGYVLVLLLLTTILYTYSAFIIHQSTEGGGEKISIESYGLQLTRFTAHKSAKDCTAIEYSFGMVQVEQRSLERVLDSYKMSSEPHGVCAIINNEKFSSHSEREGTQVDETNLAQCFRYLGYKVEVLLTCVCSTYHLLPMLLRSKFN